MAKALWVAGLITLALLGIPGKASSGVPRETPQLSDRQAVWLDALIWCESKDIPVAINPKDRDGTPSYGLLQFKPETLALFEKKYGITGDLMSSSTQKAIVTQMILQGGINWGHQFPDCVKRLGTPPSKVQ